MCGIAGFTHLKKSPDPDRIWEITRSLIHRGPDQQGVWESARRVAGSRPAQDHRSGARRSAHDQRRRRHRSGLQRRDLQPYGAAPGAGAGGSPLPFALRHRDGAARVSGMGHRRVPPLPRDVRRGLLDAIAKSGWCWCAITWASSPCTSPAAGENVYFGSELKAILLHPEIDRTHRSGGPDRIISRSTTFRDRGRWWRASKSSRRALGWNGARAQSPRGEYWRLEFDPDPSMRSGLGQGGTGRTAALGRPRAAGFRRSPGRVVAAAAWIRPRFCTTPARTARGRLKTFSVSFQGRSFDESRYFREVAQAYGTDHHEFDLNPDADLARRDRGDSAIIPTSPAPTPARCRCGSFPRCAAAT